MVAYQEDGIIKMNDSAEVIKQIYSDLATIFGYTETEAEAIKGEIGGKNKGVQEMLRILLRLFVYCKKAAVVLT